MTHEYSLKLILLYFNTVQPVILKIEQIDFSSAKKD